MGLKLLSLINPQGWVGIVLSAALGILLAIQVGHTHHYKNLAQTNELAYQHEHSAFLQTIVNYQRAAEQARQADAANKARVEAEQRAVNQRTNASYEARIADARARADRLRSQLEAATHPSGPSAAPVPGVRPAPGSSPQAPGEDGLSDALIATEQAIQLDELIKWVKQQAGISVNGPKQTAPSGPGTGASH